MGGGDDDDCAHAGHPIDVPSQLFLLVVLRCSFPISILGGFIQFLWIARNLDISFFGIICRPLSFRYLHWQDSWCISAKRPTVCSMGMHAKAAIGKSLLGVAVLMLRTVAVTDYIVSVGDDTRCLFDDRETCKRSEGSQCDWCDLPQECYHLELVYKLGANCNGSQRRQLQELQDCTAIALKEQCLSYDHCRWCRSKDIDDSCFKAWEARRLPHQVFDCSKIS